MRRRRGTATAKDATAEDPTAKGAASRGRRRGSSDARTVDPQHESDGRYSLRPAVDGPRVRLGILWFFLALAAVTAGRWSTAVLWGVVGALAAVEILRLWWPRVAPSGNPDLDAAPPGAMLVGSTLVLVVAAAAALGTGIAGVALVVISIGMGAAFVLAGDSGPRLERGHVAAVAVAVLLPALTVAAVVLVVGAHLWAGLFLVVAVSLYDAGFFVGGAESSSRLEGPVTGIVGVLAATFTMAMFQAPPFDAASAAVAGAACAAACPLGQWVTSACLPTADSPARSARRLDAYVVAAPALLVISWAVA